MQLEQETALVEAILFLEAEPVDEKTISRVAGIPVEAVRRALEEIEEAYASEARGLSLVRISDGITLAPKESLWPTLRNRYGRKNDAKLSRAAMETLSIIAYSQPITRAEVENLRGVSADGMIRLLLQRDMIREVGKKDAPGRPVQYGTTREFLKVFRLSSISDLPKLDESEEERFRLNG